MTRDPRRPGGSIAGPGGPHDRNAIVIDSTDAVLHDHTEVALIETSGQGVALAVQMSGRINKTTERADVLFLMNGDGAAALVSELLALAGRIGPEFEAAFMARVTQLAADGNTTPPSSNEEPTP